MTPKNMLIGIILLSVMMFTATGLIGSWKSYYNFTVDSQYTDTFNIINNSQKEYNSFASSGIEPVEGKGTATDAITSAKVLEGGFSYFLNFLSMPSKIINLMSNVGNILNVPGWVIPTSFLILSIIVISAIVGVFFRTGI